MLHPSHQRHSGVCPWSQKVRDAVFGTSFCSCDAVGKCLATNYASVWNKRTTSNNHACPSTRLRQGPRIAWMNNVRPSLVPMDRGFERCQTATSLVPMPTQRLKTGSGVNMGPRPRTPYVHCLDLPVGGFGILSLFGSEA